ncbi:unnamed protein product (macronuclear) [Paramecium tetraurelia]|uniref:MORN repeat protein n=1 Tax=Paramecium tetraurelia TaxID=5888 RepID=A0BE80_PARTE|nr:uncharacterized protein GSPATT00027879001 [Paramecium tetraurelia]CAK56847.1 unnamed protein product [Paramecium tetraurelia]|eukprot:XP_001424245.1 hypothetical protein (macronuclear) [Paramecium tetraurelia strain d4-2]
MQNSHKTSQQKDERINELLRKIPSEIRQIYDSLGPLYDVNPKYQIIQQNDGSVYFVQGDGSRKIGTGVQIWPEQGNVLDGNWDNDQLEGYCRMVYSNKDIYQLIIKVISFEYLFKQGRANGFGLFQTSEKTVKGIWIDNNLSGEGQEFRKDGQRYYGQFQDGQKNGQGIIYFKDGYKYEGELRKNLADGSGTMIWSDCSYYDGEFRLGVIKGRGVYLSGNGYSLMGYFKEEAQKERKKKIQRIIYKNESGSNLIIEKIRQL